MEEGKKEERKGVLGQYKDQDGGEGRLMSALDWGALPRQTTYTVGYDGQKSGYAPKRGPQRDPLSLKEPLWPLLGWDLQGPSRRGGFLLGEAQTVFQT